jgi:hypothetical protein
MHGFWGIVASNALVVAILAVLVAFLGRIWKNPAALHFLWVLVLLKLITPPLATLPIPLPATHAQLAVNDYEKSQVDPGASYVDAVMEGGPAVPFDGATEGN